MPTARLAPAARLPASTLPAPAGTGPRLLPWTTALTGTWIPGCDPGLRSRAANHLQQPHAELGSCCPWVLALPRPGWAHQGCPALAVALTALLMNP